MCVYICIWRVALNQTLDLSQCRLVFFRCVSPILSAPYAFSLFSSLPASCLLSLTLAVTLLHTASIRSFNMNCRRGCRIRQRPTPCWLTSRHFLYTHQQIRPHAHMFTHRHTQIHTYTYIYTYAHTHAQKHALTRPPIHAQTHKCTRSFTRKCTCI